MIDITVKQITPMRKNYGFRAWFYFRQGWSTYFAFILAAINVMVTTYYLAIKDVPSLKIIFPSFANYAIILSLIGIPILISVGYIHYKKLAAFSSETDILNESHPYNFKSPPGWYIEVQFPLYLALTNMILKSSKNEKLTDEELNEMTELQKKIEILMKGGYVGKPTKPLKGINSDKELS